MQVIPLAAASAVLVSLATSVFLNVQQHAIIGDLRSSLERNTIMPTPDDYAEQDEDAYVRGYHQATEDMGCVPSASARYASVEAWKKKNGITPLEDRQAEIAERIEKAISTTPTKGEK